MNVNPAIILGFLVIAAVLFILLDVRVTRLRAVRLARSSDGAFVVAPHIASSVGGGGDCGASASGANGCA
jgi:hypothetical protein